MQRCEMKQFETYNTSPYNTSPCNGSKRSETNVVARKRESVER